MRYQAIIDHVRAAHDAAAAIGIPNIMQPGLVKELILAEKLGHNIILTKAGADAEDAAGSYEYLTCLVGNGSFQMDRMTEEGLYRITRNRCFYCAFFRSPVDVEEIWEVSTADVLVEATRQIRVSKNAIAHVGLTAKWVRTHGRRV